MSESLPKKRVLVLHGWTQNGERFKERIKPFCQACEKRGIELVFVTAPHAVDVDEILEAWNRNPAFTDDGEYDLKDPNIKEVLQKMDPRTWWTYDRQRTLALGHGEALDVVREALEKQTFDGVFGFSQGGALAAITAAVLERPALYPSFMRNGAPIHPPLKFCVSVCGFRLIDPVTTRVLTPSFKTQTVHVLGEKDAIVPMQRSQALVAMSENSRVIKHKEGHIVPLAAPWTAFYCDFIENPSFDIPAPTGEPGRMSLL